MLKVSKKTIQIELPPADALTAGLDPHSCYPPLRDAERELIAAQQRLETARIDVETRKGQVEHLGFATARGADAGAYEQAHAGLYAATALIGSCEDRVQRAQHALEAAREAGREAVQAEAFRRQEWLNAAGRVLLAELKKLDALQDALAEAAARLPIAPGAGVFYTGNYRDQRLEEVAR